MMILYIIIIINLKKNDAISNTTIIYNSEIKKEFVYFNDSDFYVLDYIVKLENIKVLLNLS